MGLWDKFKKKQEEEKKYEMKEEEEEEVFEEQQSNKRLPIEKNYLIWGGVAGVVFLLFVLNKMFGGGSKVVIQGDPEAQKKLLEETIRAQSQMNQQILEQLKAINEKLSQEKKTEEPPQEKEKEKKTEKKEEIPTFQVEPSTLPPPPSPPPSPSAGGFSEPPKPEEPYKPKINRIERKEEEEKQSKAGGIPLAQASVSDTQSKQKTVYLPAGTTLKGRIINSFPAPVGGEKFPAVLIELEGYARLPNNYRLDLSRCLLIAKGEGSYVLERAKLEAYKLSCIMKNGKVIEAEPKGMVVSGEDGMEGVQGKFLNVNREQFLTYLGGTTLSGFFSALSQAQIQKYTTAFGTTTDIKNEFLYSLYGSLAQTWNEFARWYLDQAKKVLPVVVVQGGKPVYVVLVDGLDLGVSVDEFKKGI